MPRPWLVLALALSLWPSSAAASPGAPDRGPDVLTDASSPFAQQVLRSDGGLELIRGFQSRESEGRDGTRGASDLLSGHERQVLRLRPRAARSSDEAANACPPLCERLPYDATAPPSRR